MTVLKLSFWYLSVVLVLCLPTLAETAVEKKAKERMKRFSKPEGLVVDLFADETQTKNPTAFIFDGKGRLLVCEVHRYQFGSFGIHRRMEMIKEDIANQSNEDRLKMYEKYKHIYPMSTYTGVSDVIRMLEDRNGDGRVDTSSVYADGFQDILDGPGIGLLERKGKVYYTNIPHLWLLEDKDGDGKADQRKSLQDGFGLRLGFSGHDMHGLAWGPDGKVYWSIGDRGYSVKTKEGKVFHGPNEGAVFRCDPDGSNVEKFYDRLRNPQELAFDQWGNLFTADNDGDRSDLERINYLIEGGDSGWHAGHQSLMSFTHKFKFRTQIYGGTYPMNAWEVELMWKEPSKEQPAFMLPGIGQINGGPSGFAFNPSDSMGKEYDNSFFVIHYKGSPQRSRISNFRVVPKGASFKVVNLKSFFSGSNCVDVDFGPDGKLYISEFNYGGWQNQNVGAIYSMYFPKEIAKPSVKENHKILTRRFSQFNEKELGELLENRHRDIRLRAQFELAERSDKGEEVLKQYAKNPHASTLSRVHGIWGLGMMARKKKSLMQEILPLLKDKEDQVRIQTARVLGDNRYQASVSAMIGALKDEHTQVAMYAAIGLGRIGDESAREPLIDLLKRNDNQDVFLRHAVVMGLKGLPNLDKMMKYAQDPSVAIRMGVLLCLRHFKDPRIATFLKDQDQSIVYEAIRAINDLPIHDVQEDCAAHLLKMSPPVNRVDQFMHHRVINANFYRGTQKAAERLLIYASNPKIPSRQRREALAAIEAWSEVHQLDTTTGLPRKVSKDREPIDVLTRKHLNTILNVSHGDVLAHSLRLATKVSFVIPDHVLEKQTLDDSIQVHIRLQSLEKLQKQGFPGLVALCKTLLKDKQTLVRKKALANLLSLKPKQGRDVLLSFAKTGTRKDQQIAYQLLQADDDADLKHFLLNQLQHLKQSKIPAAIQLDVIDAAKRSQSEDIKKWLESYEISLKNLSLTEQFASSLEGGDRIKGQHIFYNHGTAQCIRCHKVRYRGSQVGPNLTKIGKTHNRGYLLQALVDPSATIAPGYGLLNIKLTNGKEISGTLLKEDQKTLIIKPAEGKNLKIDKREISQRNKLVSGMPPMHGILKRDEIRDLVEFLVHLK